jgi:squalene-hopene/tetraprenyl-beta-curcumene cyclase
LSLLRLNPAPDKRIREAVFAGCDWLLGLQNSDGGFPTFSRGWSKLPFDQSCADLTGHAINALALTLSGCQGDISPRTQKRYRRSLQKALSYLIKNQHSDGSWVPLWFGNQNQTEKKNPVYGTARVCAYLTDAMTKDVWNEKDKNAITDAIQKARDFLFLAQNKDGSWGGEKNLCGTVEETSLAISALAGHEVSPAIEAGLDWLSKNFGKKNPAPIGLYFASLWYDEKLYPYVMYAEALERVLIKENK